MAQRTVNAVGPPAGVLQMMVRSLTPRSTSASRQSVGHACGGNLACSTCHVYVTKGFDALSEIEDEEFDILDKAFDVRPSSRLGCQAKVHGDIEVEISDESFQAFVDEHPNLKETAHKQRA